MPNSIPSTLAHSLSPWAAARRFKPLLQYLGQGFGMCVQWLSFVDDFNVGGVVASRSIKGWAAGLWGLLYEAGWEFTRDKASRLAASLSFYTAFSIAPLLVIAIAIA